MQRRACGSSGRGAGAVASPVRDYNAGPQAGAGPVQFSTAGPGGTARADAFNTFVEPVLRTRPNLVVASEGLVRRVLFDLKGLRSSAQCDGGSSSKLLVSLTLFKVCLGELVVVI